MASDSDTALATQQSIKAYVDAQQDTVDTFAEILALSNTTGGTDLSVSTNDKVQFRDAAIYINSSTDGQLDIVADTEIQLAATTVDLNGVLDVSGNIVVGGTVDGRDVASDGTKLDGIETKLNGIEASATADQSNAEIRAAVEAATDSNVFTDADHTKLNGVAANATANVGDITNVIARNGLTGGGTSGAVTVAVDTAVVATAGNTLSLNNKTLNTPVINSPDINGGTVDGATVGAGTPSTGKFAGFTAQTDQGNISIPTNTSSLNFDRVGTSYLRATDAAGSFTFVTGADNFSTQRLKIANNGAVVFYEDTGATAKLTWSASTEDLNFAHNVKATFGGGDDLQIYHDGSHSYIADVGVGNLWIGGENVHIGNPDADEFYIQTVNNGAVTLFHNNSPKIATTSTGIDVTGTAKVTQLNVRTGTSLDKNTTIKDDAEITSWTETGQSLFVGVNSGSGAQQAPHGLYVKPDGMRMYLIGSQNGDDVEQFSIASASDAFDISKMVADDVRVGSLQESNAQDIYFADDPADTSTYGKKMYVIGTSNDRIRQYTISTAWDLSSTVSNAGDFDVPGGTQTSGLAFGRKAPVEGVVAALGTRVYVVDSGQDNIKQFDLGTAWDTDTIDVSTRVDVDVSASAIFDSIQACTGIRFNSDGTEMYLTDNAAGDDVTQFGLSTPYDIASTITNEGSLYTGESDNTLGGLHLVGTNIYTVDPVSDTIRQYTSDNTGIVIESSSVFIPGDLRVRDQITALGLIRVDGQLRATGGSQFAGVTISGALTCSTNTGVMRLGGTSGTAQIDLGRSTKTQTVNVYDSVTASGETATVNIGTSGASGSATNINIGGGSGTCTVKLANLPTHADEAAANTAGLAQDTVYKTSSGELRIKL